MMITGPDSQSIYFQATCLPMCLGWSCCSSEGEHNEQGKQSSTSTAIVTVQHINTQWNQYSLTLCQGAIADVLGVSCSSEGDHGEEHK